MVGEISQNQYITVMSLMMAMMGLAFCMGLIGVFNTNKFLPARLLNMTAGGLFSGLAGFSFYIILMTMLANLA